MSRETARDKGGQPLARGLLRRMQHAEGVAAVGVDQQHDVLAFRDFRQHVFDARGSRRVFAVHLQDNVALGKTGVVGWAGCGAC